MIGTILSMIAAIFLLFNPLPQNGLPGENILGALLMSVATTILVLFFLTIVLSFNPLAKIEQHTTPRLLNLLKKDKHLMGSYCWIMLFVLLSFLLAFDAIFFNSLQKNHLLALWVFIFGVSIDIYHNLLKRLISYLNPFDNVLLFRDMAQDSIQNDKELDLCDAIDSLTEIAVKAEQKMGTSLCNQVLQEMQLIVKNFLSSSKSIGHVEADIQSKALGIKDRISYTLFYVFDRITLINDEALLNRLEQVVSTVITVLGKIAIHCARFDLTLVSYPVHFLSRNAKAALNKGMSEIGVKASMTLFEVSKTIIEEVDYTYADLKDPFFSINNGLEEIAKETFLQDKSTNLKILTQPFRDLKELFQNPKVINHQDTPAILLNIDRVLGEYDSLELVMRTIPPIPDIPEEKKPNQ